MVVCDGAMGTMLYSKGISLSRCFDELNLSAPHLVKEVHLGYVKAGAEVVETNTFGATRLRLAKFDLGDKVREINIAGAFFSSAGSLTGLGQFSWSTASGRSSWRGL